MNESTHVLILTCLTHVASVGYRTGASVLANTVSTCAPVITGTAATLVLFWKENNLVDEIFLTFRFGAAHIGT